MQVIRTIEEMNQIVHTYQDTGKQIGFVPTMGFLHEGHLSLMKTAREENDVVVASIFVNPLQFGPNEDYEQYPRDEQADTRRAVEVGVDFLFTPSVNEMYPAPLHVNMNITERVDVLCGRSRPGHFDGVLTVLTKLFHIVSPSKAYFGLKDAQQIAVVDSLIQDLNFPVELVGLPTIRDQDGLAKSSRNVHLTEKEKSEAVWMSQALQTGQQRIQDGEHHPENIVNEVKQIIDDHISGKIDYVELLSYPNLKAVNSVNQQVILAVAVYFDRARLIDNLILDKNGEIVHRYQH